MREKFFVVCKSHACAFDNEGNPSCWGKEVLGVTTDIIAANRFVKTFNIRVKESELISDKLCTSPSGLLTRIVRSSDEYKSFDLVIEECKDVT